MDSGQDKSAIEERLARCRQLLKDYPDGPTSKHLRELEGELLAHLRAFDGERS